MSIDVNDINMAKKQKKGFSMNLSKIKRFVLIGMFLILYLNSSFFTREVWNTDGKSSTQYCLLYVNMCYVGFFHENINLD